MRPYLALLAIPPLVAAILWLESLRDSDMRRRLSIVRAERDEWRALCAELRAQRDKALEIACGYRNDVFAALEHSPEDLEPELRDEINRLLRGSDDE